MPGPMEPNVRFTRNGDGTSIAYTALGQGPPDIVWVPNFTSHVDAWWLLDKGPLFVAAMTRIGRLLQFDQPGTGASDPLPRGELPTMEQWMDDVRVVLDAEGIDKAVLIAEDSGGPVALLFAATHPERVHKLVLVNSYARMERDEDYPWGFPSEAREQGVDRWQAMWGTGAQIQLTAPSFADDPRLKRDFALVERLSAPPSMARSLFEMISQIDVRDVLPAVRVPTLVIHRKDDPWIRVEHGRYLAQNVEEAEYLELPGDAHYGYLLGDTDSVVEAIDSFITGAPPGMTGAERVLSTLLFTDIVGSTETAAQMGDRAWRRLIDQHDSLVQEMVTRYRGRPIRSTGDGYLATFDGPARAVRAAAAIRHATVGIGIHIRSGVHTGEIELRGEDIGGIGVHVGARVAALAGSDEILVSQTVKDLTIGSGIEFTLTGEHELKGVPGAWKLYRAEL